MQEEDPFALVWLAQKVAVERSVLAADLSVQGGAARHNPQIVLDALQYSTVRHVCMCLRCPAASPILIAYSYYITEEYASIIKRRSIIKCDYIIQYKC